MATEDELRLETENLDLRRLLAQAGIDAAQQKGIEKLQRIVLEELHHRVKNTLSVVMAITSQSLRTADSLEHASEAIEHRLLALGRAHDLLLESNWTSATLASIIKSATEPFDAAGTGRFFIQSSNIDVGAAAVLPLAMVLNELCTNAVKYGALSNEEGTVEISAISDKERQMFQLKWKETGGPKVTAPTKRSFGTRLIEHSFVRQLQGDVQLQFAPSGVICTLDIPLLSIVPPPLG